MAFRKRWLGLLAIPLLALPLATRAVEPAQQNISAITGYITSWQVNADGSLLFKVEGGAMEASTDRTAAGGTGPFLWFQTPPDKTATTNVEELIFDVILATREQTSRIGQVTARGKSSPGDPGKTPEDPLPMVSIGQP